MISFEILLFLLHRSGTSVPILKATVKSYSLSMAHLVQWGFGVLEGFLFKFSFLSFPPIKKKKKKGHKRALRCHA